MRLALLIQTQVVRSSQKLEAQLNGDFHIRNVVAVAVAIPVVKVLDHLVKDHGTIFPRRNKGREDVSCRLSQQSSTRTPSTLTAVAEPRWKGGREADTG